VVIISSKTNMQLPDTEVKMSLALSTLQNYSLCLFYKKMEAAQHKFCHPGKISMILSWETHWRNKASESRQTWRNLQVIH